MRNIVMAGCTMLAFSSPAAAWEGYDRKAGTYIEIEEGQAVHSRREIEYYDFGRREYRRGSVEAVHDDGASVEIEVYDRHSGEYRTFEMANE
ncbi:MAG: DUF5334 family protein [Desulfobulbus sp.]|jgi:hypothetical protein|uniref:DUF5334 family protein n=1 Tax=Desulfobulbus sp. TaxID=895 RepID=UPI00284E9402|nr:DUF5334 family protein [Desulfobulbus sp.]MDR2548815.1 DUF5334 family protein [Desulfobulbus sp.]